MGSGAPKVEFNEEDYSFFIAAVTEGRNCMLLTARRGPLNTSTLIGSVTQYRETYGIALPDSDVDQVIQRALDRGAVLYLSRVVHYSDPSDLTTTDAAKASITLKNAANTSTLTLEAANEGSWGNTLTIEISQNEADEQRFDLEIIYAEQPEMNELFTALTMNNDDARYAVTYINTFSKLITATDEDSGDPFASDTVTVDNTTLSANVDFPVDIKNINSMAAALAAAIEAKEPAVNAVASNNVVTVTAASAGTSGNAIVLTKSSVGNNITVSGNGTLSGGANAVAATGTITYGAPSNGDTITVAGTLFTKVAANPGANEFSSITELTALIQALASVNASDNGSVITVVAANAGTSGNAITMSKTGTALTLSGATLSGGAAAIAATGTITFDTTPTIIDNPAVIGPIALSGGDDGLSGLDDDDWIGSSASGTGFHAFSNIDDAFGLSAPEADSAVVTAAGIAYCEAREDMVYYCETPSSVRTAAKAVEFRTGTGSYNHAAFNSSYGAMYFGRPKVRSAKTNSIVDISNLGDVYGVHAYSDRKSEVWFAPAGMQRGRIPNTLGVHYNVGTPGRSAELDQLSDNQINAIVDFPGDGTMVWDELTLQRIPSALQSLHVRRLLIYMRKALTKINRIWLFEPNDPVTWRRVYQLINPWMADLLSRRAFYEYLIQCDQDARSVKEAILNTPERVDRGEFVCRLFIKPTKTLRKFGLQAVITKTSADFSEILDVRN